MASHQIPSVRLIPLENTASAYMITHSTVVDAVTYLINVGKSSVLLRLPELPLVK